MKKRTGYVYFDHQKQTWTARITFTDEFGKRRNVRRSADSEATADKILRKPLNDLETKGEKAIDAERMTFSDLAERYSDERDKVEAMMTSAATAIILRRRLLSQPFFEVSRVLVA